jgi:putative tricarboxylic transport membrane protein
MTRDRAAAIVLLVFGLGGAWEAFRLTIGEPGRPGPGFFPFWLALALAVVAVALIVQSSAPGTRVVAPERLRYGKVVLALVAGAVYAFALEPLGFLVTTFAFLMFLLSAIEARGWLISAIIAGATALASHVVFKIWLGVQLPAGPWGF